MEELQQMSSALTEDFLSERLSKWFKKDIKYTEFAFCEGTGKGDSYLSDVFRLTFHGKKSSPNVGENPDVSVKVIIKCLPRNIGRRRTFRSHDFFRNEINFYEIILPTFMKFQAEKGVQDPFNNCPKVFASLTNGKDDFLALEDLSVYNYGCAVRQEGIDYPHIEKVLETFAKFHALSFAFKDQHPQEFEKFDEKLPETYYSHEHWNWYAAFWKLLCTCAVDAAEKELPGTIYEEKMKAFATEEAYFKVVDVISHKRKSDVVSHGDSWTPNFLFQYDKESNIPVHSMMIDFQLARCSSPVLDVCFFIYACSTKEMRSEKYNDMLKYYYDILARQIRELGSDPDKVYSRDEYMEEIQKFSFYGLVFGMEAIPVTVLEPDEAFEMDSITGTDIVPIETIWNIKPMRKPGRERLCGVLVHAVDMGYM